MPQRLDANTRRVTAQNDARRAQNEIMRQSLPASGPAAAADGYVYTRTEDSVMRGGPDGVVEYMTWAHAATVLEVLGRPSADTAQAGSSAGEGGTPQPRAGSATGGVLCAETTDRGIEQDEPQAARRGQPAQRAPIRASNGVTYRSFGELEAGRSVFIGYAPAGSGWLGSNARSRARASSAPAPARRPGGG